MTRAKFVIKRTTKNQLTTLVNDPPAKTRSFVRAFLLERSSSSISTNPPGRNIARKTPEDLIGTLSSTLAMPWAASCGMSNTAIEMSM